MQLSLGLQKAFINTWELQQYAFSTTVPVPGQPRSQPNYSVQAIHLIDYRTSQNEPHTTDLYERNRGWPPGQLVRNWIWEMAAYVKSVDGNHMVGCQHALMYGHQVCTDCLAADLLTSARSCTDPCNNSVWAASCSFNLAACKSRDR